ncbi:Filamin-A [Armadillidium vulgare]|nr:Filamin-A [Armadillidium vulgare]
MRKLIKLQIKLQSSYHNQNFISIFRFSGREIPKSPFRVNISGFAGDPSKVTASGPGLQPNVVMVNRPTYFEIFSKEAFVALLKSTKISSPEKRCTKTTSFDFPPPVRRKSMPGIGDRKDRPGLPLQSQIYSSKPSDLKNNSYLPLPPVLPSPPPSPSDAGRGTPEVIVLDPSGHKNTVPVKIKQISEGVHRCEYVTTSVGLHSINVFFAGQPIPGSPFGVKVSDVRKVKASGRGLQPIGVRVKDEADFKVYTEGAGEGNVEIKVIGPGGITESIQSKQIDEHITEYVYHPKKEGKYTVHVGPYKETAIRAYGPGLKGGVVGYPALFTVETNGETGALGFSIEGPSQAKIECNDNGDGSADVSYYPTVEGEYALHILCNNEDIPGSPHIAQILPKTDYLPEKVVCTGPGLEKNGVICGKSVPFKVDTRKAGEAPLDVEVMTSEYNPLKLHAQDNKDKTYDFSYRPQTASKHTVQVSYGGVAVPDSPFRVFVTEPTDAAAVKVFGPGVESVAVVIKIRDVQIALTNENGQDVPHNRRQRRGTFTVEYEAPAPGKHRVTVLYGDAEVPQSPLTINVLPQVDVTRVKVDGLEPTAPINSLQQFRVITQDAGRADFSVSITSPSGMRVRAHVVPTREGYLVNFTPTELGEYLLSIQFGGQPISAAPYRLTCTPGGSANSVKAWGPGLSYGVQNLLIDTREAGQGGLGVTVEGPCEAAINCRDNGDGTCAVAYLPTETGIYSINITFNDEHIHGSPFTATVTGDSPLKPITVSGDGIQPHGVFVDIPTDFVVDTRALGNHDGKVLCLINNPSGSRTDAFLQPLTDGAYKISYTPFEEGRHTIELLYDGVPIPGSPFTVNVKRDCDPNKCNAYGPGLEKGIVGISKCFHCGDKSLKI